MANEREMIALAVTGAAGRMGTSVIEACAQTPTTYLAAAIESPKSPYIGKDAGEVAKIGNLGVPITEDLRASVDSFDVLIDFTIPEATLEHALICREAKRSMVIGTTGLSGAQRAAVSEAASEIAVVFSPNMSVGVNLCLKLLELAAQALGNEADIEIVEAHHRHKRDAPSGTALRMGEVVTAALGTELEKTAVYGREKGQNAERNQGDIGFSSLRAGDIVGEHTVLFATPGERVEITHRATNRMNFAYGAIRAALWVAQQQRGLFDTGDVLGLK